MTTYRDFLPELWGCVLFDKIRNKNNEVYGNGFLNQHLDYAKIWINKEEKQPGRSNIRLRVKNICVYCGNKITDVDGVGDHIVSEFKDRSIIWTVPCCKTDNSSKGKKDLIDWWCGFKENNIIDLGRDVMSIFVRAKHRHLENIGELNNKVPEMYHTALEQIKNNWERV